MELQQKVFEFPDDAKLMKAIKTLSENCHRDISSIEKCSECFNARTNDQLCYFTKVCSKPHLLVYVKTPKNPFWPAKVMLFKDGMANVEFFGDHSQADVPVKDCLLYANHMPGRKTKKLSIIQAKMV